MTSVGIAVAVYNGARTIDGALGSIAAQTRQPDVVVVVDDGSGDETLDRVRTWSQVLPLEVVSFESNRGVAAARIAALDRLDSDVVLALDADDFWLPHHLRLLTDVHLARGGVVNPTAVPWRPDAPIPLSWAETLQPPPRRRDLSSLLIQNWMFSGALFPRQWYEEVGATYRFAPAEDWDLWLRLLAAGVSVETVDQPTVLYRISETSISANDQGLASEIAVLECFLTECDDPRLRRVARRSLRHRHARVALLASYDHATEKERLSARVAALRSLSGPRGVAVRGAAMAIAPLATARRREESRR